MHEEESVDFRDMDDSASIENVEIGHGHELSYGSDESHEPSQYLDVPRLARSRQDSSPVFFDAGTDDGSVYSFYDYDADADNVDDEHEPVTADLFSDDEFEPINMSFSKRPPTPLVLPMRIEVHINKSLPPSPRSIVSHLDRTSLDDSTSVGDAESMSRSTLYSMDSSGTSETCVTQTRDVSMGGCSYYDSEKPGPSKLHDTDGLTPTNGNRDMVDLQSLGYDFSWNRFDSHPKGTRGLKSEDSAGLEGYVSRVSTDVAQHQFIL